LLSDDDGTAELHMHDDMVWHRPQQTVVNTVFGNITLAK